jgi:hypothetical protein
MIGFMDLCGTMWYHVTMWDPCSLAKLVSFTELTRVSGSQTSRFFIEVWTNKSFTGGGHLVRKKSFICKPPFLAKKKCFRESFADPMFIFPVSCWKPGGLCGQSLHGPSVRQGSTAYHRPGLMSWATSARGLGRLPVMPRRSGKRLVKLVGLYYSPSPISLILKLLNMPETMVS